jgi:hypothetical protein
MESTQTIRVPKSWRDPIYMVKEKFEKDLEGGAAAIAALLQEAAPEPEPERPTKTSTAVLITAGVPKALARGFAELCELYAYAPQVAVGIVQHATATAVDAAPKPVPQGHIKFRLENEHLKSDYFTVNGRLTKIPCDTELSWPEAAIAQMELELAGRPSNFGRNPARYTKIVRL